VVEAEEVESLASLPQVHDARLGVLELEPKLGQDRRERLEGVLGFPLGLAHRQQIVGLCRAASYAEWLSESLCVAGIGWECSA
jgi:hypothetical protein